MSFFQPPKSTPLSTANSASNEPRQRISASTSPENFKHKPPEGHLDPVESRAGQLIQDKVCIRLRQWSGASALHPRLSYPCSFVAQSVLMLRTERAGWRGFSGVYCLRPVRSEEHT